MCLIFSASTGAMSSQRTSRLIGPFLRWLNPATTDQTIYRVQYAIRKGAHLTEYAILSLLVWRALRKPTPQDSRPWNWQPAVLAVLIAGAYAATDEFHQSFVPSREGRWQDVLIDTTGAALGMIGLRLCGKARGRW